MEGLIPDRLAVLGHPQRLAVFRLLMRRYPDHVPAGELADAKGLKPSTLSAYLSSLMRAGLVTQERVGTSLRYAIDMDETRRTLDYVFLDCPPSISLVSENIFRAADGLLLPLIPTTLSLRTYGQLLDFLDGHRIVGLEMMPFFSMVDRRKRMHLDVMASLPDTRKELLQTTIPYASDVEKMGIHRMPVGAFDSHCPAWKAYEALWEEVQERIG